MTLEEKKQGLLLHATAYLDKHKILKVLTPTGLVTFIAKYSASPKNHLYPLTIPYLFGEWIYQSDSRKEIYPLIDGSSVDPLHDLKTTFLNLTMASQIAKDLLLTQLPGKCAAITLPLSFAYLQKIAQCKSPEMLICSFRLKLL